MCFRSSRDARIKSSYLLYDALPAVCNGYTYIQYKMRIHVSAT